MNKLLSFVLIVVLVGAVSANPNTCSGDVVCSTLFRPICARLVISGQKIFKDFGNQCQLSRENCNHPSTPYVKHGVTGKNCAEQQLKSVCSAACTTNWEPICGLLTKGGQNIYKNFDNDCAFWNRNCLNSVNQYVQQGEVGQTCEDQELSSVCSAACPKNILPACGLYEKYGHRIYTTFSNECLLEQFNCRNPELEQTLKMPVGKTCPQLGLFNYCSKACDRSRVPICAWRNIEGKIEIRNFQNECLLVQANCLVPKYPFHILGEIGQTCENQGF